MQETDGSVSDFLKTVQQKDGVAVSSFEKKLSALRYYDCGLSGVQIGG